MAATPPIAQVLERNVRTLAEIRRQLEAGRTLQDRTADRIASFAGSSLFFVLHALWFGLWICVNLGFTRLPIFDPFPFGLLTMIVSLEAIFLSTFILISQNRLAILSDRRADLDLQVNLLAEHEITRILTLVDAIADHLHLDEGRNPELEELKRDYPPDLLLREMERRRGVSGGR